MTPMCTFCAYTRALCTWQTDGRPPWQKRLEARPGRGEVSWAFLTRWPICGEDPVSCRSSRPSCEQPCSPGSGHPPSPAARLASLARGQAGHPVLGNRPYRPLAPPSSVAVPPSLPAPGHPWPGWASVSRRGACGGEASSRAPRVPEGAGVLAEHPRSRGGTQRLGAPGERRGSGFGGFQCRKGEKDIPPMNPQPGLGTGVWGSLRGAEGSGCPVIPVGAVWNQTGLMD